MSHLAGKSDSVPTNWVHVILKLNYPWEAGTAGACGCSNHGVGHVSRSPKGHPRVRNHPAVTIERLRENSAPTIVHNRALWYSMRKLHY